MSVIDNTVVVGRSTMEKAKTRDEILKVALDLFSVNGYEATSISQIADAVGIRKASLYSHFSSKQEILDNVVASVLTGYDNHSVFANTNWDDPEFTKYKKVSAKLTNKCTILQSHLKECKRPKVKVYTTKQINAAKKGKPLTKKVKGKDGKTKTITINPKPSTCVKYVNKMLYKKGYLSKKTYKNYGSYWTKYSRRALKKYQKKWNKKGLRPKINEKGTISKNCWKAIKRYTEVK